MSKELIRLAFQEDLLDVGDVTSQAIFSDEKSIYKLFAKDSGILCGIDLFIQAFHYLDQNINFTTYFTDGDKIQDGDLIADLEGKVTSMLQAERIALNFLSNLSAIATKTAHFVEVANGETEILDTRKTLPGFRALQKYAVKCGGGTNHRMGLYDMVMIKDNHHDAAGGIAAAITKVRERWEDKFMIEVETRNLAEVKEAIANKVDVVMLDNMSNEEMQECVRYIAGRAKVEASGNMNLERISGVAATGVDYISIGALTHTVAAFDFSLRKK